MRQAIARDQAAALFGGRFCNEGVMPERTECAGKRRNFLAELAGSSGQIDGSIAACIKQAGTQPLMLPLGAFSPTDGAAISRTACSPISALREDCVEAWNEAAGLPCAAARISATFIESRVKTNTSKRHMMTV